MSFSVRKPLRQDGDGKENKRKKCVILTAIKQYSRLLSICRSMNIIYSF